MNGKKKLIVWLLALTAILVMGLSNVLVADTEKSLDDLVADFNMSGTLNGQKYNNIDEMIKADVELKKGDQVEVKVDFSGTEGLKDGDVLIAQVPDAFKIIHDIKGTTITDDDLSMDVGTMNIYTNGKVELILNSDYIEATGEQY